MPVQNRLLRALPESNLQELLPLLEMYEMPNGAALELPGETVRHAHFFERGFASIMIHVGERTMEVGLLGREGMLGLPAMMGTDVAEYHAVLREDAVVHRVEVAALREFMGRRRAAGALLLRFIQAGVAQIAHLAFASTYLSISQRLARWLLMAHDRAAGDTVTITHATLADGLGVQRSGITLALRKLQKERAISASHRAITVIDRRRLIAEAAGSYGPAERAYRLLLGSEVSKSAP